MIKDPNDLLVSQFDYALPERLIAQSPLDKRSDSRLMIIDREKGHTADTYFFRLADWLQKGDVLVINDTKVIPARLLGHKPSGGQVECLLLQRLDDCRWKTLVKPGKRLQPGAVMIFGDGILTGVIEERGELGERVVRFSWQEKRPFEEILDQLGEMPLPPYIHLALKEKQRYQTVYAKASGSAAAPTAGLHFTAELMQQLQQQGIEFVSLTLHVGIGTFRPVKVNQISEHKMHSEYYQLTEAAAERINRAKANGHRIISVGTTSCRVLETLADASGRLQAASGWTDIFIYPGYRFKLIDGLITNFHLPKSTLLMLVSAFSSWEIVQKSYQDAVQQEYRFFSFGDVTFFANHAERN
ncbi:MAG TPA: tRNA preQ1(34) S-adenosylmethionine ribosyltransferase-isomerase QueA [Bacillota bacterium]|nr:tRNA preQ1(34) S-adenosylmethionine ribosyltransferase-isomerase QueA [Bacillota bacterium]